MTLTLIDDYGIIIHAVNKPVFFVDPAAPQTVFVIFQWFWFTCTMKRSTPDFFKKRIDFFLMFSCPVSANTNILPMHLPQKRYYSLAIASSSFRDFVIIFPSFTCFSAFSICALFVLE